MFTGKLNRLKSTNNNLRTESCEGYFLEMPAVDLPFYFYGDALVGDGIRTVATSTVVSVEKVGEREYVFKTLNSTYSLSVQVDYQEKENENNG